MGWSVTKFLNSKTRSACSDYHELEGPSDEHTVWRPILRLVLILLLGALLIALAVVRYGTKDIYYTRRVYKKDFGSELDGTFLKRDAAGNFTDVVDVDKGDGFATCPCSNGLLPWMPFTNIFAMNYTSTADANTTTRVESLMKNSTDSGSFYNTGTQFFISNIIPGLYSYCQYVQVRLNATIAPKVPAGQYFSPSLRYGCIDMFQSLTVMESLENCLGHAACDLGASTVISTVLKNRVQFVREIADKMMIVQKSANIGIDKKAWPTVNDFIARVGPAVNNANKGSLNISKDSDAMNATQTVYDAVKWTYEPFSYTLIRYQAAGGSVTDLQQATWFRESMEKMGSFTFNGSDWGMPLGVDINWTPYYEACDPPYCDVVRRYSDAWRVFNVIAEVGGFLSIVMFALRSFLWPATSALLPSAKGD